MRRDEKGVLLGLTLGYDSFWEKTLQEELFAATLIPDVVAFLLTNLVLSY
jgi:hypothetical protein